MFQSPQAITISIFYFIVFAVLAFLAFKHMQVIDAIKALTPFFITTLLFIYDTDCLVKGGCYVYSWIRTVLYLISIIIIINIISLSIFTTSNMATSVNNTQYTLSTNNKTNDKPTQNIKPEENADKKPPNTLVNNPSGTTISKTEKFASWKLVHPFQQ